MATVYTPFAVATDPRFTERLSYLTQFSRSGNGTEQRAALRPLPNVALSFLGRTLESFRTGWQDALLYAGQATQYAVPFWPHGVHLAAAATAGSSVVLSVDTTDRPFASGGFAVLWNHEGRAEEVTLSGVTGSTITVATLVNDWPAGTFVFPAYRGNLTGNLSSARIAAMMAETPVTFALAPAANPGVATPETAEVFDVVPYIRRDVRHDSEWMVDRLASPTSGYTDYALRETPIGSRGLRVWLDSRSAVADLTAWFHGLRGACTAFWLPTYQADLPVTAGLGTTTLTITRCGYTTHQFPALSRRHLAAIAPSGTVTHCTVTASVDNGLATGTETLTLDQAAPAGTLVGYLLYGRLASDVLEIRWRTSEFADCELAFVELPAEVV